jgi:uncharacterized protein (TIGR03435 family)
MRVRTTAIVRTFAAVIGSVAALSAQTPAPTAPAFEVASVRRSLTADTDVSFGARPGGWAMTNAAIGVLIRAAYPAQTPELIGAPDWVISERYDVTAKAAGNPPRDQITLMLRTLLAERFKLAAHYETVERPVYALMLARGDGQVAPGLVRSNIDCDAVNAARREGRTPEGPTPANGAPPCAWSAVFRTSATVRFGGLPLSRLGESVGRPDERVIIDRTGLPGNYEFTLHYSPREAPADTDPPSLFTALEEQLGLKLVPDRAPLQVLVIDAVERPTPD